MESRNNPASHQLEMYEAFRQSKIINSMLKGAGYGAIITLALMVGLILLSMNGIMLSVFLNDFVFVLPIIMMVAPATIGAIGGLIAASLNNPACSSIEEYRRMNLDGFNHTEYEKYKRFAIFKPIFIGIFVGMVGIIASALLLMAPLAIMENVPFMLTMLLGSSLGPIITGAAVSIYKSCATTAVSPADPQPNAAPQVAAAAVSPNRFFLNNPAAVERVVNAENNTPTEKDPLLPEKPKEQPREEPAATIDAAVNSTTTVSPRP